jgi:oligopeptide transport system substrate-binding protein
VDRDAMIQVIYSGLGQPAYGMLPPGIPGYPGDALNETQKYDPELAKKLLAEAGYPDGKGFPEVELWYKTYEDALPLTAQMIQAMLKENLNIDVKLRPTEKKVFNTSFDEGQIDFGIQNWEYDYVDPSNFLNVWNPALGRHKEWNNAEFNKLTNEAAGYPDLDKRIQMYTDANRILSEDAGGAFLYHWGHAQMWKPYVRGIPTDAQGNTRVPYYNLGMNQIYVVPH